MTGFDSVISVFIEVIAVGKDEAAVRVVLDIVTVRYDKPILFPTSATFILARLAKRRPRRFLNPHPR